MIPVEDIISYILTGVAYNAFSVVLNASKTQTPVVFNVSEVVLCAVFWPIFATWSFIAAVTRLFLFE